MRIVVIGLVASFPLGGVAGDTGQWLYDPTRETFTDDANGNIRWLVDALRARRFLSAFQRHVEALGVADWVTVVFFPDNERDDQPERKESFGASAHDLWTRARAGVLLNRTHRVPASLRSRLGRTALFDVDPGPFQLWARDTDLGVGSHDAYLTIGQKLGAPDCPGAARRRALAVRVADRPSARVAGPARDSRRALHDGDPMVQRCVDGARPRGDRGPQAHELSSRPRAAPTGTGSARAGREYPPRGTEDRKLLTREGWHLADPALVTGRPEAFRRYVQQSRGEFGCAKPSYVRARPGWVSDRTVCYLASGRPCVVEATGVENHLPSSAGLRFFRTLDEAAECVRAVERDSAAAHAPRELAEEVFATRAVQPTIFEGGRLLTGIVQEAQGSLCPEWRI